MYSEPRKIVFTGLVVGAVAIGAYVSQSGEGWLSADELGLTRGDESTRSARGHIMNGTVTSGSVAARGDSATTRAGRLQAARNSLLRHDVASARAQLNAVRPAHNDDPQVIELHEQVWEQADTQQHAVAAPVDQTPQPVMTPARTSSSAPLKSAPSRDSHFATHERSNRAASYAKNRGTVEPVAVSTGSYDASRGSGSAGDASLLPGQTGDAQAAMKEMERAPKALATPTAPIAPAAPDAPPPMQPSAQTVPTPPSNPPAALTAQTVLPPPVIQPTPSGGTSSTADGGPKTRAQVRAEIARARQDGSLPAFGNPNPAGPGGAPSMTGAPRP